LNLNLQRHQKVWHVQALVANQQINGVGGKYEHVKFVSVCPGWVGTNIAPKGIARTVLKVRKEKPLTEDQFRREHCQRHD
jgi:hypothetical protein